MTEIHFYRRGSQFYYFLHKLELQEELINMYEYVGVITVNELGGALSKILALRESLNKFKLKE
ncbi:hypothetical protein HCA69_12325 [Listeria grandensis]|uniref:Uncharacterized protein n=1 Tax=Listeria grandensis TaxID=1494963 RepID=A0A7X0Y5J8_9LIST|nr:hypothetical protein [Listeria grandensis]MBC1937158.1 hypothetical protein [Listeria grandensis]